MIIWDAHCHLSGVPGQTPQERTDQLLAYAARMGIEKIALSMGMRWSADPNPDDLRRQNDEVLAAVKHRPAQVLGFVYLNPKHLEVSLGEIERCVAKGPMVGIKLWIARHCNAPELDPLMERAAQLKVPVLQHTYIKATGNLPEESTPMELAELARRHPAVSFIGAHMGGDWELGIAAVRSCPNISMDLCGFDPCAGVTERAVAELGPERVIFGSDAGGRSFASQLGKLIGAQISLPEKRLIAADNFKRLLAPIFKQKGIAL